MRKFSAGPSRKAEKFGAFGIGAICDFVLLESSLIGYMKEAFGPSYCLIHLD